MFYLNSHHAFPDKLCGFCMFQTIFKSSEDKMNYDHRKTCELHNVLTSGDSIILNNLSLPGFSDI